MAILFLKLFIFLALIVVQLNFVPLIHIYNIVPDLLLIVLFFWCRNQNRISCVTMGFFAGILQDFAGGGLLGVYSLSKSVTCYLYHYLSGRSRDLDFLYHLIIVLICIFVHSVITFIFTTYSSLAGFFFLFLRYGLPSCFYTLGVWLLVFLYSLLKKYQWIKDLSV